MKRKSTGVLLVLFSLSIFFAGCNIFAKGETDGVTISAETTTGGATSGTANDRQSIDQVLESDDFYKDVMADMFDEGEDDAYETTQNVSAQLAPLLVDTTLTAAKLPAGWRRRRRKLSSVTKNYAFNGDNTTCNVTVTRNIESELLVDTTFFDGRNPGEKPIADTITFKFYLEKNPGWRIVKISPREIKLTDTSKQKVFIDRLRVIRVSDGETVFDINTPDQLLSRKDLPVFSKGEKVKVMVTVRNIDPSYYPECYVYLHRFIWALQTARLRMFDDGTRGDEVANDGVFTNTWTIWGPLRQHAAVDVLDSKCLQNETEDDYNSNAWGVPYIVAP